MAAPGTAPSPLWYSARATGVVALVLLTLTVALGVAGTTRVNTRAVPRVVRSGLHRNLSLLSVGFVATHVLSAVLDPYAGIRFVSAIVPFSSHYRPFWLSLGTIAFDMLLALVLTGLMRSRLSYGVWRAVHWLAYASWPIALWHGLGTGTDSRLSWLLVLDAASVLVVAAAVLWRIRLIASGRTRAVGRAVTAAVATATVVFVAIGPLQSGWASRAGTPGSMLGSAHASADSSAGSGAETARGTS
ncbi:MAG: ferric reductase-like transmembrane domain-containing protein [Actinobacteria bacterium]|nr:ferric reductase-like transmembrane domain-containing protein [Actinomycetota bacterium]